MKLYEVLKLTGLPCAFSHFRDKSKPKSPPYIVYIGAGQRNLQADNKYYHSENGYQIEYYFCKKDEAEEKRIESLLLENGYLYEKSEDVYIEDEDIFVIYYMV